MPSPSQHAFSEKVALIADVSNPVGKAVALQLALCGAFVVVAEQNGSVGSSDISELASLGTLSSTVQYENPGRTAAAEIVSSIQGTFGRLDLLINCTKFPELTGFSETGPDEFMEEVTAVVQYPFHLTQECLALMNDRPKPKILNIFPSASAAPISSHVLSRMLTAAMAEFTVSLSSELGVKYSVNGIRIGDGFSKQSGVETLDPELFRSADGVDPDDVARAALFLLSSEAKAVRGRIIDLG